MHEVAVQVESLRRGCMDAPSIGLGAYAFPKAGRGEVGGGAGRARAGDAE